MQRVFNIEHGLITSREICFTICSVTTDVGMPTGMDTRGVFVTPGDILTNLALVIFKIAPSGSEVREKKGTPSPYVQ